MGAINTQLTAFSWNFSLTFISAVIKKGGLFIDSYSYEEIQAGPLLVIHPKQVIVAVSE